MGVINGESSIGIHPENDDIIWVGGHYTYGTAALHYTTNGGNRWVDVIDSVLQRSDVYHGGVDVVQIEILTDSTTYISFGNSQLLKTNQGITDWENLVKKQSSTNYVAQFSVNPKNSDQIIASFGPPLHVWITKDGGGSWKKITENEFETSVNPIEVDWERRLVFGFSKNQGIYKWSFE